MVSLAIIVPYVLWLVRAVSCHRSAVMSHSRNSPSPVFLQSFCSNVATLDAALIVAFVWSTDVRSSLLQHQLVKDSAVNRRDDVTYTYWWQDKGMKRTSVVNNGGITATALLSFKKLSIQTAHNWRKTQKLRHSQVGASSNSKSVTHLTQKWLWGLSPAWL